MIECNVLLRHADERKVKVHLRAVVSAARDLIALVFWRAPS